MSALETLLRASLAYVRTGRVPLDAVEYARGPQCNACDPADTGCSECCTWGDPLCGQRCPGFRGSCESGGERLRDGAFVIAGASVCRACALAACCGDDDDFEAIESALSAMGGV